MPSPRFYTLIRADLSPRQPGCGRRPGREGPARSRGGRPATLGRYRGTSRPPVPAKRPGWRGTRSRAGRADHRGREAMEPSTKPPTACSPPHAPPPIGVMPIGTGNDFINLTRTGRGNPARVVARLAAGVVRRFDVGRAWDEYFVNSLGVGFDARVASHVPQLPLAAAGAAGVPGGGAPGLPRFRPPVLSLRCGGRGDLRGPLFAIEVGIGVSAGGGFYLTPDARPDDGACWTSAPWGRSVSGAS